MWHLVSGDSFDERRAAPPAYGRREWSKVVPYLTTKNVISQPQVKIEKRSLADFSRRSICFPHAFTCYFSCVDETLLFAAQTRRKKISKNFCQFSK